MEPQSVFLIMGLVAGLGSLAGSVYVAYASGQARNDRLHSLERETEALIRQVAAPAKRTSPARRG